MASTVELLIPKMIDNSEELAARLESLPSFENLTQNTDEPAVFDDDGEPSTGLINLIRRNSQEGESTDDSTNIVRIKISKLTSLSIIISR